MTYLPTTESGLRSWGKNFRDRTQALADPTTVGLTALEIDAYDDAYEAYATALDIANEPTTRGGSTIQAKNIAKAELIRLSRLFAMAMTKHPGVTDQQRYDFGLTVTDKEPTPVPVPDTAPVMTLVSTVGRTITMRLRDADNPDRRARPTGVNGATVMMYVGETPAEDPVDWSFLANTTKTDFDVTIPLSIPADSKVWLSTFWFNTKSESGPVAPAQATIIRASMPAAA